MLVKLTRYTNTGNSVADHTEAVFRCNNCKGEGWIYIDKQDLLERMEGLTLDRALRMYRSWKLREHRADCPECDGLGEWTDRF